jgi:hypothetical protein
METRIIKLRKDEVEAEILALNDRIAVLSAELNELDIAEKVFLRLSGAGSTKQLDAPKTSDAKPDGLPTIRDMIKEALSDAMMRRDPGMTPKEIRAYIKDTYGFDAGPQVNTTASRMLHALNELSRDEATGLYSLSSKEKSSNATAGGSAFEDLLGDTTAKGREAGPGGGA